MRQRCLTCGSLVLVDAERCHVCGASLTEPRARLEGRAWLVRRAKRLMLLEWGIIVLGAVALPVATSLSAAWPTRMDLPLAVIVILLWITVLLFSMPTVAAARMAGSPRIFRVTLFYCLVALVFVLLVPKTCEGNENLLLRVHLFVATITALGTSGFVWRAFRQPLARQNPIECTECGYNLTGNTSGTCPECGAKVSMRAREFLASQGWGTATAPAQTDGSRAECLPWSKPAARAVWVVSSVIAALFFVLAYREPPPTVQSSLTGIFGYWSLPVGETGYEVGCQFDNAKGCRMWKSETMAAQGVPGAECAVSDVVAFGTDGTWILASTRTGWSWIDVRTGQVQEVPTEHQLRQTAPPQVRSLLGSLIRARPSYRQLCSLLGVLCLLVPITLGKTRGARRSPAREAGVRA